jgi:sRNA-binding carbon storage regulator CsrA
MTTLTVTRKDQERIVLVLPSGEYITVHVCERVKGGTRLIVSAPEDVQIWREEVLTKAAKESHDAATVGNQPRTVE